MRKLVWWIVTAVCSGISIANAETKHIAGVVHPSLPQFDFAIYEIGNENNDAKRITSIEVRSVGKLVQTIRYEDNENAPIDYAAGDIITLEDVDCDGYKDLLVRSSVGVHGNAWFILYLFDPSKHQFIEYAPFADLPYVSVSCRTGMVKTYVNSGAAGCAYQAGLYHWVNHVLLPVRIESQELVGWGSPFRRTIRVWRNDKEIVLSEKSIPADDCHAPDRAVVKKGK